ncbi:MAG: bifunctional UDP-sugar hydrolase/5'-nucleotidase, partial [Synergistaceae bacterium]|nr:bifunctional UDP-sugar hydrolase/5'-nucleotidase [Synergistaceae bacterium]
MNFIKRFAAALLLPIILCTAAFCAEKSNNIVILYTNDVHSAVDTNIGYAGITAMKKDLKEQNRHVLLVDNGDIIQGDPLCTLSKGMDTVDIFNHAGYDYMTLGNHEFDYGLEQLSVFLDRLAVQCLNCNITYSGTKTNALAKTKPYAIKQLGGKKIAFIGVTTPDTYTSARPDFFKENGKTVYSFFGGRRASVEGLAKTVQEYVNECRRKGADYVILLSHLGDSESKFNSRLLIRNSYGIDVVLDGHDHHTIPHEICKNRDNKDVLLTSTGTRFAYVGKLTITPDGKFSSELVSSYAGKDGKVADYIAALRKKLEQRLSKKTGHTAFELSDRDTGGIRLVRNRETGLGNLCA